MPFIARLVGAALFLGLYLVMWRRYRPSRRQHIAALLAGVADEPLGDTSIFFSFTGTMSVIVVSVWWFDKDVRTGIMTRAVASATATASFEVDFQAIIRPS